jgi:hypothetical protein
MVKSAFSIAAVAAVAGLALTPVAASAATSSHPAILARSNTTGGSGDPDTTVTFTVTATNLTMTAPTSANLGSGAPGGTISGPLGAVTVTDDRALLGATWTTTASATNWTTGTHTGAETIPATDVGYDPGTITTTPTAGLATGTAITLSGAATPVVSLATDGNSVATWDPTLSVAVPVNAVGGLYTGVLTQSVAP